jgi:hypothetical protein
VKIFIFYNVGKNTHFVVFFNHFITDSDVQVTRGSHTLGRTYSDVPPNYRGLFKTNFVSTHIFGKPDIRNVGALIKQACSL